VSPPDRSDCLPPTAPPVAARVHDSPLDRPDLRLLLPALTVWSVAAGALGMPVGVGVFAAVLLLGGGLALLGRPRAAVVLTLAGAACVASALRLTAVDVGPVTGWAKERAVVTGEGVVVGDPVTREGQFGPIVFVELRLEHVAGRGEAYFVRTPVLVFADESWSQTRGGQRVWLQGRLGTANGRDLGAVLIARGPPRIVADPSQVATIVNTLRQGLRESVAGLPPAERSLVPALVVGDDRDMPEEVAEQFRATGLTHLLAVSGANLTLLLAFVLPALRLVGVRARGLAVAGMLTVVFFVLLARPDPSVLRAAAMGTVAMAGLGAGGRRRGSRALCAAVVVLVLVDPWLARSVGFLLSVLATGAILWLAPPWRDALAGWMPRWLAEAIAVPAAAQLVCTPVVLAISGQVSLVAVVANLLAGPAVGPATVLGLLAALTSVVSQPLATGLGWLAGRAAWWIVTVAEHGSVLPGAAVPWPSTTTAVLVVSIGCLGVILLAPTVLGDRLRCLVVFAAMSLAIAQPFGGVGGAPRGWVLAMCDVGQGDGLVINAGENRAVVVDAGPDRRLLDRCLDHLEVEQVPMVILSHLHADHAAGLGGVFDGRAVGAITLGPLDTPADQYAEVRGLADAHGVPVRRAAIGESAVLGDLRWSVIGPVGTPDLPHGVDGESAAENDASLVLRLDVRGLSVLLTGDVEPGGQQELMTSGADLDIDVLKVPHHGSRHQDSDFLAATTPMLALVSAGADNDYGHPSRDTLDLLEALGARVLRTDRDGTVVVVSTPAGPAVVTHW
jgi:competence protein ComEC